MRRRRSGLDTGGPRHALTAMGWLAIAMPPFVPLLLLLGLGAGAVALRERWRG